MYPHERRGRVDYMDVDGDWIPDIFARITMIWNSFFNSTGSSLGSASSTAVA
jgi:hypothetical protein